MATLEEQFRLAELMAKPTTQGGMSYADRPNPYGLRAFETDQGYGGEMMPKTSGWAGEIPSHESGKTMTEVSLGGEGGEPFYPMIYEGITPEEIEVVRDYEAGLREDDDPLVVAVKAKAKESARKRMHMHKSPFKDIQPKMAKGGKATSFTDPTSPLDVAFEKWRQGDAPLARMLRGEGHKIIEDLNKPAKPMTSEEMTDLAMNIGPMALGTIEGRLAKHYMPLKSELSELAKDIENAKGKFGVRRLERAADTIPNLDQRFTNKALEEAFMDDNATSLLIMPPKDFEKYASALPEYYGKSVDADRKSTRLNSSHIPLSRMPSSA